MSDDNTAERAKEMLVYGPVGLALFLRDSAPQFMRMFVARGRNEIEQRRKSVGAQIGQARKVGESVAAESGPEVLTALQNGLAVLREKAEEALNALGVFSDDSDEPAAPEGASADRTPAPHAPANFPEERTQGIDGPMVERPEPMSSEHLAIPGYDDLSASQIVDRLDALSRADLEAIYTYETAQRARNTILGKIEQLTRAS